MNEDKLLHIKINYEDGVNSKMDILNTQASLIKILQDIKKYHALRQDEFDLKEKMKKITTNAKTNITKLTATLPKIKVSKIIQKEEIIEEVESPKQKISIPKEIKKEEHQEFHDELEIELAEIQEKLRSLASQ